LQKLRLKLSGAQEQRIAAPITAKTQTYQLYLNGVYFRRKNGTNNLRKAVEYQKQAIALDPNFAEARGDEFRYVRAAAVDCAFV
jgi:hypothetical protein